MGGICGILMAIFHCLCDVSSKGQDHGGGVSESRCLKCGAAHSGNVPRRSLQFGSNMRRVTRIRSTSWPLFRGCI